MLNPTTKLETLWDAIAEDQIDIIDYHFSDTKKPLVYTETALTRLLCWTNQR